MGGAFFGITWNTALVSHAGSPFATRRWYFLQRRAVSLAPHRTDAAEYDLEAFRLTSRLCNYFASFSSLQRASQLSTKLLLAQS